MINEDGRDFVVEHAIKNNLSNPDEINLFQELSIAMELEENKKYNVVDSGIGCGIDFGITTCYPDGLPENIGNMFFNVSAKFDVKIEETQECANLGERYFKVNLKKV